MFFRWNVILSYLDGKKNDLVCWLKSSQEAAPGEAPLSCRIFLSVCKAHSQNRFKPASQSCSVWQIATGNFQCGHNKEWLLGSPVQRLSLMVWWWVVAKLGLHQDVLLSPKHSEWPSNWVRCHGRARPNDWCGGSPVWELLVFWSSSSRPSCAISGDSKSFMEGEQWGDWNVDGISFHKSENGLMVPDFEAFNLSLQARAHGMGTSLRC